jgi:hypothetical protein
LPYRDLPARLVRSPGAEATARPPARADPRSVRPFHRAGARHRGRLPPSARAHCYLDRRLIPGRPPDGGRVRSPSGEGQAGVQRSRAAAGSRAPRDPGRVPHTATPASLRCTSRNGSSSRSARRARRASLGPPVANLRRRAGVGGAAGSPSRRTGASSPSSIRWRCRRSGRRPSGGRGCCRFPWETTQRGCAQCRSS